MAEEIREIALVTGASAGIGWELARRLAAGGRYRVVAVARREDRLRALAETAPAGAIVPCAGDLCDPAFRRSLLARAEAEGPVALLINNAGYGRAIRFAEQPIADIDRMIDLNVVALVELTHAALEVMLPRGRGRILQVASLVGLFGMPHFAAYAATKHFVVGFVDSLRYELRGTGVSVSAVCPGSVRTEFGEVAFGGKTAWMATFGEPVERVAGGILRRLHSDRRLIFPTLFARLTWLAYRLFPWPFRAVLSGPVRKRIQAAFAAGPPALPPSPRA